ncbi:MAG: response regulator transcription factor [Nevskiaceae bacterium]|nr:MAG: response regulator transcription factor [Nevskiaceae bacterium]
MTAAGRILVVDDEPPIRRLLRTTLQAHDYEIVEAATAAAALTALRSTPPDVVILDLGLPDRDGLQVIADIRALSPVPILIVSSRDDERGKVAALDAGADDYVTKPFGAEELLARIRTALRHRLQQQGSAPRYEHEGLAIDLVRRIVSRDGVELRLSPKEYALLEQLALHAGKVLTHRHLQKAAWADEPDVDIQYLRIYIRQLRGKIERSPEQPTLLLTEPGVGYRLRAPA